MTNSVKRSPDITCITVLFTSGIIMLLGIALMPGDDSNRFFQTAVSAVQVGGITFVIFLIWLIRTVFAQCEQEENS